MSELSFSTRSSTSPLPKKFVVGVDPQSAGFAWGTSGDLQTGVILLPKYKGKGPYHKRYARLAFLVAGIQNEYPFNSPLLDSVYVEEPMGQHRGAQSTLNQLVGCFVAGCTVRGIPVFMINTSTWKSEVFMPARKAVRDENKKIIAAAVPAEPRDKDAIMERAVSRGYEPDPDDPFVQDRADAYMIAQAGRLRRTKGLDTW